MLSSSLFSLHHLEVAQTVLADTEAQLAAFVYDEFLADTQNDSEYKSTEILHVSNPTRSLRPN